MVMNRAESLIALLPLVAFLAVSPTPAWAQSDTKAASVAAFDDAQRLMAEARVADACVKFAESERLDPQLGTLLHLADCLEKNGRTASAWSAFREAAERAAQRQDPRQQLAEERARTLQPGLSKLQINVPASLDPATVQIERDKVAVGHALWGVATPIDPGPHTIVVTASGRRPWKTIAVVGADGSTAVVDVPELETEGVTPPRLPKTHPAPSPPKRREEGDPAPNPPRWTAFTAFGVGAAGVVVGTIFGLSSKSKRDEAERVCPGNVCADSRGVDLADDAIFAGNVSTAAFVIGGVGLAAGTTLWIVGTPAGSNQKESAMRLGVGPKRLVVEGTF